jgi:predicted NodU family carbamoyl transferase
MNVMRINAVFHDPAAPLVVDRRIVAAVEEVRFTRRKHALRGVLDLGVARGIGTLDSCMGTCVPRR